MRGVLAWSVAVSLLGVSHAEPAPTATYSRPNCPSPIGLVNGGFESGKLDPWTELGNSNPTTKQTVVSPGYQSNHALKLQFVPANITEYSLAQSTTGEECPGYYYNISYAWNWLHYTGPEGNGDSYCAFSVATGYTEEKVSHYATRTPGWHHHSYVTQQIYLCHRAYSEYVVDVTCVGKNYTEVLPGFTMLIDDFKITNAARAPQPQPPGTCH